MLYRIVMITDLKGNKKEDKEAVDRIGRIIKLDKDTIVLNKRLFMTCVDPGFSKSIITSHVIRVDNADDGLIITTENSMYFLVEKEIAERYDEMEYQAQVEMAQHFDMNGDNIS